MSLSLKQNEQYSELSEKLKGLNGLLDKPVKLENSFFSQVYNNMNHFNADEEKYITINGLITEQLDQIPQASVLYCTLATANLSAPSSSP